MSESEVVETKGSNPLPYASHERYARARALMHKPIEAARIAGFSETSGASSKVERRRDVQARIAWLTRQPEETIAEKRMELEAYLWRALRYDPMIFWDGSRLRDWAEIDPDDRTLIEGLMFTEKGKPNLRVTSRLAAHIELRKMLGGDAPAKIAQTDPSGDHAAPLAPVINLSGRPEAA